MISSYPDKVKRIIQLWVDLEIRDPHLRLNVPWEKAQKRMLKWSVIVWVRADMARRVNIGSLKRVAKGGTQQAEFRRFKASVWPYKA